MGFASTEDSFWVPGVCRRTIESGDESIVIWFFLVVLGGQEGIRVFVFVVGVLEYRNAIAKGRTDRHGFEIDKPGLGLHRRRRPADQSPENCPGNRPEKRRLGVTPKDARPNFLHFPQHHFSQHHFSLCLKQTEQT
jgi:hypothetical protein